MSATEQILQDLKNGRKVSQLDCREYGIEDMRTIISHLGTDGKFAGWILRTEWFTTEVRKSRLKRYWLEAMTPAI